MLLWNGDQSCKRVLLHIVFSTAHERCGVWTCPKTTSSSMFVFSIAPSILFYRQAWDSSFLKYFKILAGRVLMTLLCPLCGLLMIWFYSRPKQWSTLFNFLIIATCLLWLSAFIQYSIVDRQACLNKVYLPTYLMKHGFLANQSPRRSEAIL